MAEEVVLMVAEGLVETTAPTYWEVTGKTQTLSLKMTFPFRRLSVSLTRLLGCLGVFYYLFSPARDFS